MNSLVVFDSQFGNTEDLARAIGKGLETVGPVRVVSVGDSVDGILTGVDFLVIGGPTQAHGARPALRRWLAEAPIERLRRMDVATFDTRLHWPAWLSGS
ncbi:MAG TPA: flavodoxin domain-containing protein, partial [Chloroflexota bacterium]|nr:flavodoxin domain-containing protein [Chloroflexota bacterium]